MANKNSTSPGKDIDPKALALENQQLADRIALMEAENKKLALEKEELRSAMDKGEFVGEEIAGTFKARIKNTRTGKTEQKELRFKRGHKYLYIDSKKMLTSAVIKLATGEELDEDSFVANPQLKDLTMPKAKAHLEYLAKIGYGYLEVVN